MRKPALAFALTVALVLVPPAAAKNLVAVEVCGASGCNRADDEQTLRNVPGGSESEIALGPAAPFYRVTLVMGEGRNTGEWTLYYVPSQNAMAYVDPYESVRGVPIFGSTAKATMQRLTAGLTPYRPPHVTSVEVGRRVLNGTGATSYLRLYRAGKRARHSHPDDWVAIDLRSAEETPWTVGARELLYSPDANVIDRGGVFFEVPDWLAADVEAARPLARSETWRPPLWLWMLAAVVVLGVAGTLALKQLRDRAKRPAVPTPLEDEAISAV